MAVVSRRIDLAATGAFHLPRGTSASNVMTRVDDIVSDSSREFELPRVMRMTRRDFRLFLVALDTNEEPNEKLKALFRESE